LDLRKIIYLKISGSKFIIIVLYVDDILVASSDLDILFEIKYFLSKKFDMKDIGEVSYVISIEIHRDQSREILGLSQKAYIEKILKCYNMQNCSPSVTPIIKGDKFSKFQCPKNDLEHAQMKQIPYASVVGSLMYAQVCTCSNITFVVGMLGRYQTDPGMDHWKAAKKVLHYLQRTKNYMLTFRKSDNLEVIGYSDSDFFGCVDSKKSTSSYIFMLVGGPISWKSAKQSITAASTMQVEFVACYEATGQAVWLKNFIPGLQVIDSIASEVAIFFSKNNKSSDTSKWINIKYLVVRDKVKDDTIVIQHINTRAMLADSLTKMLPSTLYKEHVAGMNLVNEF
jgi:Reverse transcriptase (RNA-dependent DNA polymerase)